MSRAWRVPQFPDRSSRRISLLVLRFSVPHLSNPRARSPHFLRTAKSKMGVLMHKLRLRSVFFLVASFVTFALLAVIANASIFGNVRGLVHDPQHRPIAGANVVLKAVTSDFSKQTATDQSGECDLCAFP